MWIMARCGGLSDGVRVALRASVVGDAAKPAQFILFYAGMVAPLGRGEFCLTGAVGANGFLVDVCFCPMEAD